VCDVVIIGFHYLFTVMCCVVFAFSEQGVTSAYMPLGVVAMSERVSNHFAKNVFFGGLTYSGHPMSMAAGVANLRVC
jgi:adenosylmethionine-8-amino-7-oxononanoate aminotransferase